MPDRLAELRRQRALIAEHLAWLDRQIAEASGNRSTGDGPSTPLATAFPAAAPASPVPTAEAAAVVAAALKAKAASGPAPESPIVEAAAATILDEYRQPEAALKTDVRKGCIL